MLLHYVTSESTGGSSGADGRGVVSRREVAGTAARGSTPDVYSERIHCRLLQL